MWHWWKDLLRKTIAMVLIWTAIYLTLNMILANDSGQENIDLYFLQTKNVQINPRFALPSNTKAEEVSLEKLLTPDCPEINIKPEIFQLGFYYQNKTNKKWFKSKISLTNHWTKSIAPAKLIFTPPIHLKVTYQKNWGNLVFSVIVLWILCGLIAHVLWIWSDVKHKETKSG